MAWTAPRTWVAGEIVTAAIMNTYVRDDFRYLKGINDVPLIESGIIIDNTDGDEMLKLPLLSTAECAATLASEGKIAADEQTHRIKMNDGTAVRSVVTTADVDDTPADAATTDPISSNWAYDLLNTLTTAGDIIYATAARTWVRLAIGTAGQSLRVNGGATAPAWTANPNTQQFFVPCFSGAVANITGTNYAGYVLSTPTYWGTVTFRVPNDFVSLTTVKAAIVPSGTGTFDWTAGTTFGAAGEAYNANTDSATADGQAVTNLQLLELDISAAFTGIAANDIVNLNLTLDALATASAITILGIDFKYT